MEGLPPAVAFIMFVAAVEVLRVELRSVTLGQLRDDILSIPGPHLALAILLTAANYIVLGDVALGPAPRRQRVHEGVSGREVLARLEGRADLRGNVEHAVADDR
jgi:hypothetical protein